MPHPRKKSRVCCTSTARSVTRAASRARSCANARNHPSLPRASLPSYRARRAVARTQQGSGDAQLPGHSHFHQSRARGIETDRAAAGGPGARARRTTRRDQLSFARRPPRKTFPTRRGKGIELPLRLPVRAHETHARLKLVGKAMRASDAEIQRNPRARSACCVSPNAHGGTRECCVDWERRHA